MTGSGGRGGRLLVVLLLLLATAAFGTGVAIERSRPAHTETTQHEAGGEAGAEGGVAEGPAPVETHADETFLGVNTESTPLVALGIALSIAAAAAVWLFGDRRSVLAAVGLFCLAFAVLDVVELARRAGEDAGIAVAAVAAASLHTAAAAAAGAMARRERVEAAAA